MVVISFDGYRKKGGFEPLAGLARAIGERWCADGFLVDDLEELRGALFIEQRRYYHYSDDPSAEDARYVWALVGRTRELAAIH